MVLGYWSLCSSDRRLELAHFDCQQKRSNSCPNPEGDSMMSSNLVELVNPVSALLAGLATSFHCAGMCGPISCAIISPGRQASNARSLGPILGYHSGRLFSYTVCGALAGSMGSRIIDALGGVPTLIVPWAFALFFVALLFNFDRHLSKLPGFARFSRAILSRAYATSGHWRGLALGLATPFLPCGALYTFFWVAALSGSAGQGSFLLLLFGLSSSFALIGLQFGFGFLNTRYNPKVLTNWRRGLALIAITLLVSRSFLDVDMISVISAMCH